MQRQFKLKKVLEYRNLALEREKNALAELVQQEHVLETDVKSITGTIHQKREEMFSEVDFKNIEMYQKYLVTLEQTRRIAQNKLFQHKKLVHIQKDKTVAAFKNKTVMDKLQEKHRVDYNTFVDKEEIKIIEDIVLTRMASRVNSDDDSANEANNDEV